MLTRLAINLECVFALSLCDSACCLHKWRTGWVKNDHEQQIVWVWSSLEEDIYAESCACLSVCRWEWVWHKDAELSGLCVETLEAPNTRWHCLPSSVQPIHHDFSNKTITSPQGGSQIALYWHFSPLIRTLGVSAFPLFSSTLRSCHIFCLPLLFPLLPCHPPVLFP